MPVAAQLEVDVKCYHDYEMAFLADEVDYMFDTALRNISELGSYTCALECVKDVQRFMQIRFLGPFVTHELISKQEADEIFHDQEEKVMVLSMK